MKKSLAAYACLCSLLSEQQPSKNDMLALVHSSFFCQEFNQHQYRTQKGQEKSEDGGCWEEKEDSDGLLWRGL